MNILQIGIIVFLSLEALNVLTLYFQPSSKKGNGIGVFNSYEKAMDDPDMKPFVTYLINWVAGVKLIFVLLGFVIVFFGNHLLHQLTLVVLIISVMSYYWRLAPQIKSMDLSKQITPVGYSKTLNYMIGSFIFGFIIVLLLDYLL